MSQPSRNSKPPSYRLHKKTGQAVVTLRLADGKRRDFYLGVYGSPESRTEYARLIAELAVGPPANPSPTPSPDLSLNEILLGFLRWAETHYRTPDGELTTEVKEIKRSIGVVRELYGHTPAAGFGPKALAAARQKMVDAGWCRTLIDRRIDRLKRVFRWATAEELVPVSVYQALRTLSGLQKGRTRPRESEPPSNLSIQLTFPPCCGS